MLELVTTGALLLLCLTRRNGNLQRVIQLLLRQASDGSDELLAEGACFCPQKFM